MLRHPSASADGSVFMVPRGWSTKATANEIAVEHVRMMEVMAGGDAPDLTDDQAVKSAIEDHGTSIAAHVIALAATWTGKSLGEVMEAVEREVKEILAT